jgi:hypothetical protein
MESQTPAPAATAEVTCSICYEPLAAALRVQLQPCLHSEFCRNCMTRWIGRRNSTCPMCRADIVAWRVGQSPPVELAVFWKLMLELVLPRLGVALEQLRGEGVVIDNQVEGE